ncbi:MAG: hypothetical protein P8172_16550, partial [Gammaproteobacteria bacterium]
KLSASAGLPDLSGQPADEAAPASWATGELRDSGATRGAQAMPEPARPDPARFATLQIADAIRIRQDGAMEITLQPEELGRVRLSFSTIEGTLSVHVGEVIGLLEIWEGCCPAGR